MPFVTPVRQYDKVKVEVIATKPSLTFFKREDIEACGARVWTDEDEWSVRLFFHSLSLYSRNQTLSSRNHIKLVIQSFTSNYVDGQT